MRHIWTALLITGCGSGEGGLLDQLGLSLYPDRCGGPCADDADIVVQQSPDGLLQVDFSAELWTFPQMLHWEVSETADPTDLASACEAEDWTSTFEGGWYEAEAYPVAHGDFAIPRKRWQERWLPGLVEQRVLELDRVHKVSASLVDRHSSLTQANHRALFAVTADGLSWGTYQELCIR